VDQAIDFNNTWLPHRYAFGENQSSVIHSEPVRSYIFNDKKYKKVYLKNKKKTGDGSGGEK
jgi:hypothetical protein